MHTLAEVRAEYDRLDALCGVDTRHIRLEVSTRAQRRLGCYREGRPPAISISAFVMADDALFLDTVRHEYAHALVAIRFPGQRHGHDAVWKDACREVGCPPKATMKPDAAEAQRREARANYRLRCLQCGQETLYYRRGKIIELVERGRGARVRCTRCGGNRFRLEYL